MKGRDKVSVKEIQSGKGEVMGQIAFWSLTFNAVLIWLIIDTRLRG